MQEKWGNILLVVEKVDSSGLNVPPVSLSNVPGVSESNVPPIAETNVPGVSLWNVPPVAETNVPPAGINPCQPRLGRNFR